MGSNKRASVAKWTLVENINRKGGQGKPQKKEAGGR